MNHTPKSESLIWRIAGGDASRRGLFAANVELKTNPERQLSAGGSVQASVVFDDAGRAFVADMGGAVQAFSRDGELLWRVNLPGGISATPAVHSKKPRLFVGDHTGVVCALDTADGSQLWKADLPTRADPRILSDLLYMPEADAVVLNSWGGRFHALEAETGAERTSWSAGLFPYSAAALAEDGLLYCLRAVEKQGVEFVRVAPDGSEAVLHRVPEDKRGARRTMVAAAPIADNERSMVYFIINEGRRSQLHAYSRRSGTLAWSQPLPNAVQATPALRRDGVILAPDLGGFVQGVGPDGSLRFRYESGCEYLLAAAVSEAGGTSFFGDPLGVVHAIDERGGGKKMFEVPRAIQARPSFDAEGNLYVPSTDRSIYVFSNRRQ